MAMNLIILRFSYLREASKSGVVMGGTVGSYGGPFIAMRHPPGTAFLL